MNSLMQLSIVAQSCLAGSDDYSDEYQDGRKNMADVSGVKRKEEGDVSHWFGVLSLPYPDHNYAKPPPVVPAMKSHHYHYQQKELTPPTVSSSSNQPTDPIIAPQEVQKEAGSNLGTESWEGSITRCICEFQHDDGYMICCDRCSVWQHVDCMGVDRQNIPDTYLCELCKPRIVDKHHAIRCQARKRELLMQRADSSDTDTEEDVKSRRMVMRRRKSRQSSHQSGRRKSQEARTHQFRFKTKNKKRHGSKPGHNSFLSSPNSRLPISPALTPVSMVMGQDFASFRLLQTCRNSFTPDLRRRLHEPSSLERGVDMTMYSTTVDSFHEFSLVGVSMLQISADIKTQGLEANKDIKFEEPIIEYTGKVMLKDQCIFSGSMGHVLQYSIKGLPGVDVCIDSSHHDNQAKFIRRSANPNARLKHFFDANNNLRFCIWSTTHILKGSEVTLPLEFENRSGQGNFQHTCSEVSTPSIQRRRRQSSRISESSAMSDLPTDFGSHQKEEEASDIQTTPVKSNPHKVKVAKDRRRSEADRLLHPYARQRKNSSALESSQNNVEKSKQHVKKDDNQSEEGVIRRSSNEGQDAKKLTREEKKLEAIMKAFERIDKKNERKNQRAEKRMNERMKNHKSSKHPVGRISRYVGKRNEKCLASKVEVKRHSMSASRDHHRGNKDDPGDDNDEGDDVGYFEKTKNGVNPYSDDGDDDDEDHYVGDDDDEDDDDADQPLSKHVREKKMKGIVVKEHTNSNAISGKSNSTTPCKDASPKIQERRSLRLNSEATKQSDSKDGRMGLLCEGRNQKNKIKRNTKWNVRSGMKKKNYESLSDDDDYEGTGNEESSKSEASEKEDSDDNDDDNKLNITNDFNKKVVVDKPINSPMRSISDPAPMHQAANLLTDQGFTKKRWLRQAINESSENQLLGLDSGFATPLKKRRLTVDDVDDPSLNTTPSSFLPPITPSEHQQHGLSTSLSSSSSSHKCDDEEICQDVQNQDNNNDHHHHAPTSPYNPPNDVTSSNAPQSNDVATTTTSLQTNLEPSVVYSTPSNLKSENSSAIETACSIPDDIGVPISTRSQSITLSPSLIVSVSSSLLTSSSSPLTSSSSLSSSLSLSLPPPSTSLILSSSSHVSSSDVQRTSSVVLPQKSILVTSSLSSLTSSSSSLTSSSSSLTSSSSSSLSLLSPLSPCCLSPTYFDGTNKDSAYKNMAAVGKKKVSLSEYRNRMKTVPSLTCVSTSPTYSIVTHSTPVLSVEVSQHNTIYSSGDANDDVDKRNASMFGDDDDAFANTCVSNIKKGGEWDFEETAAEKVLTKSLSLTDRLKFEFGLDAQEEVDTSSVPPTSSPALLQSSSSTSSLPTPPSYSSHQNEFPTSTQNHSGVQSSSTSSPQKIKHERNKSFSTTFRSEKERTRSHRHHHRHHNPPPDHHASSRLQNFSRPTSHPTSFEDEPSRSKGGRGRYDSNDLSPSRHHYRRRYSSPVERQVYHHRELVDPRQRNHHARNDQKYLKYHQQNSIAFSRSRFQHQ